MENSYKKYQLSLSLGIGAGIIFIVWAICVATQQNFIHTFDKNIINIISNNNPTNLKIARSLTTLGNTSTIVVEAIILFISLLIFRHYRLAGLEAGIMILGNACNWVIKNLVKRPRPTVTHLVYADGYSFPSGHSLGSVTLFGSLFIITCILVKNKPLKFFLNILWVVFPLIIGYTRIYLHVHYPSDVLGGWLEGLSFVLIGYAIYLKTSSQNLLKAS
ncbi:phosphatase PAP2 family protein [Lactobacillus sp. PV037]|uniref:phosphatase PAP2 family protein n=1 Tax=Lactobacillus sp. PV037 TaxID=2594496 RepID=UPI00223ED109|nr:phosphatase PAP2 family protein [Lactobacillus sp. PV037]QNQ84023.1 phosphatase PAP2 family protein [Lactobacillus sp. PV037]